MNEKSNLDDLIKNINDEQAEQVRGHLTVDYDAIEQFTKEHKETSTEDGFVSDVVIMAFGCIQPVNLKKLSNIISIPVKKINEYKRMFSQEINVLKKKNQEHLIGVLDVLDFARLFNPKASIETSKLVREVVLGQKMKEEKGSVIIINNLEIEMNSDRRQQIINTTSGQKELFFANENRALPEQIKPTDDYLAGYVENIKEKVDEKVAAIQEPEEIEEETSGEENKTSNI